MVKYCHFEGLQKLLLKFLISQAMEMEGFINFEKFWRLQFGNKKETSSFLNITTP